MRAKKNVVKNTLAIKELMDRENNFSCKHDQFYIFFFLSIYFTIRVNTDFIQLQCIVVKCCRCNCAVIKSIIHNTMD